MADGDPMRPGPEIADVVKALSPDTIVARNEAAVSCDIAEEIVILDVNSGIYFGLDSVAASVWAILGTPASIRDICNQLTKEYDIDPLVCADAVTRFTGLMAKKGLVTVTG
jgi:hypothetical protein